MNISLANRYISGNEKISEQDISPNPRLKKDPGLFDSVFHEVSNAIAIIAHEKNSLIPVIQDVNNYFELITGYISEDIRGRNLYDFLTGQNGDAHRHVIEKALKHDQTAVLSCVWKSCQGEEIDMEMTLRPYQSPDGEYSRFICVLREKNRAMRDMAAREIKHNLLAAMHHNFKTPLNGILGYSEVIMTEMMGPIGQKSYKNYARDIHGAGKDLLHMIDSLLDLKELETAELILREEKFSLEPMLSGCLEKILREARKSGITFSARIDHDLPLVRGDKTRLQQVIHSLLSNALKFTAAGGEITIAAQLENDGSCLISCQDSGVGMSSGQLANIFSHDSHLSDIYSNPRAGIGFGLSYVKQLMEKHDGHVSIVSSPGKGTIVTLQLPADRLC